MRIIEVSSPSAHDRGRQYGRAAADLIGTAIEYYGRAFELQTGRAKHYVARSPAHRGRLPSRRTAPASAVRAVPTSSRTTPTRCCAGHAILTPRCCSPPRPDPAGSRSGSAS